MLAPPLISILTAGGFGIRLDGERLVVHPASDLTDSLRSMIREHKPALVGYLRQMQDPANDPVQVLQDLQDSANDGTETVIARASRLWLIRHADGRLISHSFTPAASRQEVEGWYPEALSIEPEDDCDE